MALLRSRRRLLPAALLSSAVLTLAALTAPATADVVNRPDLTVTKGSVAIAGEHAERIKGRFTVRNAGGAPAAVSTAHVQAKADGKWRYLTELRILAVAPRKSAAYAFRTARPDFIGFDVTYPVRVCLDVKKKVREAREGNNCLKLGTLRLEFVEDEVDYQPDTKFFHSWQGVGYYGWVPSGYDPAKPSAVFVWLHGCGGHSEFDIESFHAAPNQSYITLAPVGREGDCWRTPSGVAGDEQLVIDVLNEAATHFNLDPEQLVIGGYSSGGDLAYRMAYIQSTFVEKVLVANSSPFRDTGLTQQQALAATVKVPVHHLAHTSDDVYPINDVKAELQVLTNAGYQVTFTERPGSHYDDPGAGGLPGTDADIQTYLLPHVDP